MRAASLIRAGTHPLPLAAPLLLVPHPLSFWGGVDPETGRLTDPREPTRGWSIAGRILLLPQVRGSSSSSAVLLELIHRNLAPAALVLAEIDAILCLGLVVGAEMGWTVPPLLQADLTGLDWPPEQPGCVTAEGWVTALS